MEDYLPAGLEFLGCTLVDNSAIGTEEYAGAPRLDFGTVGFTHPCITPSTVETVNVGPGVLGTMPAGVYTHVVWSSADLTGMGFDTLAPGASFSFDYAAGVPLHENLLFPVGTPITGVQASNLDNNTGALTTDEQALRNQALVAGVTNGVTYNATDEHAVTAEDLAVQQGVAPTTISQGAISTWTMQVRTSEYATTTSAITMTDVVPDGLCVIAAGTSCAGAGGAPVPAPVSVTGTGPTTVVWMLADLESNATTTVILRTLTDTDYSDTAPVSTRDSWTNTVSMSCDRGRDLREQCRDHSRGGRRCVVGRSDRRRREPGQAGEPAGRRAAHLWRRRGRLVDVRRGVHVSSR